MENPQKAKKSCSKRGSGKTSQNPRARDTKQVLHKQKIKEVQT